MLGSSWKGTAFGGWQSRTSLPILVDRMMKHEFKSAHFIVQMTRKFIIVDLLSISELSTHTVKVLSWHDPIPFRIEEHITHRLPFLNVNESFELLRKGECLRCVMYMPDAQPI